MDFMQSETRVNLARAFAGESQARNKYTYFASVARKEGYEQIAALFQKTTERGAGVPGPDLPGNGRQ